ncbi:hypothetical protein A2634_01195 [Candidatus Amesbacteria bacterium RIFCSPHIGHO2_01_FULL_48_32]|uniref:Uncharacterized protein n=1 Tax=Candidatus Amesbacteria bacterium RIFCSPLOWO2_01_FULL_48_25 TaxID=1797259 RepID=A0A1F4ZD59_9BACT|nr:MAG: hypothetical protein A2634_01195 [Candidatus Amesbacteria bacterium RIFCSPHIGHO2_01_FULL_48_32]OGD03657.1 MAG: hypothetical protein A2989_03180 [Candidatus Amesbacteria bacterium RIFCSPLOWO2_01_FULL_48_25]HJZ05996.1 hypothetical protein [Patescibacteria group bacterium]
MTRELEELIGNEVEPKYRRKSIYDAVVIAYKRREHGRRINNLMSERGITMRQVTGQMEVDVEREVARMFIEVVMTGRREREYLNVAAATNLAAMTPEQIQDLHSIGPVKGPMVYRALQRWSELHGGGQAETE